MKKMWLTFISFVTLTSACIGGFYGFLTKPIQVQASDTTNSNLNNSLERSLERDSVATTLKPEIISNGINCDYLSDKAVHEITSANEEITKFITEKKNDIFNNPIEDDKDLKISIISITVRSTTEIVVNFKMNSKINETTNRVELYALKINGFAIKSTTQKVTEISGTLDDSTKELAPYEVTEAKLKTFVARIDKQMFDVPVNNNIITSEVDVVSIEIKSATTLNFKIKIPVYVDSVLSEEKKEFEFTMTELVNKDTILANESFSVKDTTFSKLSPDEVDEVKLKSFLVNYKSRIFKYLFENKLEANDVKIDSFEIVSGSELSITFTIPVYAEAIKSTGSFTLKLTNFFNRDTVLKTNDVLAAKFFINELAPYELEKEQFAKLLSVHANNVFDNVVEGGINEEDIVVESFAITSSTSIIVSVNIPAVVSCKKDKASFTFNITEFTNKDTSVKSYVNTNGIFVTGSIASLAPYELINKKESDKNFITFRKWIFENNDRIFNHFYDKNTDMDIMLNIKKGDDRFSLSVSISTNAIVDGNVQYVYYDPIIFKGFANKDTKLNDGISRSGFSASGTCLDGKMPGSVTEENIKNFIVENYDKIFLNTVGETIRPSEIQSVDFAVNDENSVDVAITIPSIVSNEEKVREFKFKIIDLLYVINPTQIIDSISVDDLNIEGINSTLYTSDVMGNSSLLNLIISNIKNNPRKYFVNGIIPSKSQIGNNSLIEVNKISIDSNDSTQLIVDLNYIQTIANQNELGTTIQTTLVINGFNSNNTIVKEDIIQNGIEIDKFTDTLPSSILENPISLESEIKYMFKQYKSYLVENYPNNIDITSVSFSNANDIDGTIVANVFFNNWFINSKPSSNVVQVLLKGFKKAENAIFSYKTVDVADLEKAATSLSLDTWKNSSSSYSYDFYWWFITNDLKDDLIKIINSKPELFIDNYIDDSKKEDSGSGNNSSGYTTYNTSGDNTTNEGDSDSNNSNNGSNDDSSTEGGDSNTEQAPAENTPIKPGTTIDVSLSGNSIIISGYFKQMYKIEENKDEGKEEDKTETSRTTDDKNENKTEVSYEKNNIIIKSFFNTTTTVKKGYQLDISTILNKTQVNSLVAKNTLIENKTTLIDLITNNASSLFENTTKEFVNSLSKLKNNNVEITNDKDKVIIELTNVPIANNGVVTENGSISFYISGFIDDYWTTTLKITNINYSDDLFNRIFPDLSVYTYDWNDSSIVNISNVETKLEFYIDSNLETFFNNPFKSTSESKAIKSIKVTKLDENNMLCSVESNVYSNNVAKSGTFQIRINLKPSPNREIVDELVNKIGKTISSEFFESNKKPTIDSIYYRIDDIIHINKSELQKYFPKGMLNNFTINKSSIVIDKNDTITFKPNLITFGPLSNTNNVSFNKNSNNNPHVVVKGEIDIDSWVWVLVGCLATTLVLTLFLIVSIKMGKNATPSSRRIKESN